MAALPLSRVSTPVRRPSPVEGRLSVLAAAVADDIGTGANRRVRRGVTRASAAFARSGSPPALEDGGLLVECSVNLARERRTCGTIGAAQKRGCGSMVEPEPSKLMTRVRFPSPAPRNTTAPPTRRGRFRACAVAGGRMRRREGRGLSVTCPGTPWRPSRPNGRSSRPMRPANRGRTSRRRSRHTGRPHRSRPRTGRG